MKVTELRQIIREEISKVLNESENTTTSEEKKLISAGKTIVRAQYLTKSGEFVLETPTTNISFACAGGAYIDIASGDVAQIKNTTIKNAKIDMYEVQLEFSNGETIVLEDGTGGEGIEIYYS